MKERERVRERRREGEGEGDRERKRGRGREGKGKGEGEDKRGYISTAVGAYMHMHVSNRSGGGEERGWQEEFKVHCFVSSAAKTVRDQAKVCKDIIVTDWRS